MKEDVFTAVCDSVVMKTAELSSCTKINKKSEHIADKFKQLSGLYLLVHEAYGKAIPESEDEDIENKINNYLSLFRKHYPDKVLPKHHFLEDHVIPWIKRWGFGMAFYREQGEEALHAEFNVLKRRAHGVQNPVKQLVSIMKEHHTKTSPRLHAHDIPAKKRKLSI